MERYSVLMTVYKNDTPKYFKLALDSMIQQTVKPNEIVLVKDGPISEALQAVIDKCKRKTDVYINQVQLTQNVGLGLALNAGIKTARNEFLARMDSDDISRLDRCERQLALFKENPALDIVGCPVIEFCGDTENIVGKRDVPTTNEDIHKFARRRDPFNHPSVMYRKSKVEQVGGYGDYRKNQDTDLWIKMLSAGCKGQNIPEYLVLFRFDEGTYQKRKSWINTKILIDIRWNAYKKGFNSFFDFLIISCAQLTIYCIPTSLQRFIYRKILR